MGPLLWWWRWWAGVDPNRDKALVEARDAIEQQQMRVEQLSSELQTRDAQVAAVQKQLEESEGEVRRLQQRLAGLEGDDGELSRLRARITDLEQTAAEADQLRTRITDLEQTAAEADQLRSEVEELRADLASRTQAAEEERAADDRPTDMSEAASVLDRKIKADDFTVIEGIGPKIAGHLNDAGITTWQQLSETEPSQLRQILTDAGPRFRIHDPANWPTQAALLAHGRWQEFKDLTTTLREQRGN